jgi:hypothetical protein
VWFGDNSLMRPSAKRMGEGAKNKGGMEGATGLESSGAQESGFIVAIVAGTTTAASCPRNAEYRPVKMDIVRCVIIRCVNVVEPCDVIGGFETKTQWYDRSLVPGDRSVAVRCETTDHLHVE